MAPSPLPLSLRRRKASCWSGGTFGPTSFSEAQLAENYAAALEEVLRLKPSSSKGRYIKKITISTTMGPGVQVDPNRTRNVASDEE